MTAGVAGRDIYCHDEAPFGIIMRPGCILMRRRLIVAVQQLSYHPAAINSPKFVAGIAMGFRDAPWRN